jgi:hypothetical protein
MLTPETASQTAERERHSIACGPIQRYLSKEKEFM